PALHAYLSPQSKELFVRNHVFSERELEARHEINLEEYIKKVQIESRVMGDLATNHVIPTAIAYQNKLVNNVKGLKELGLESRYTDSTVDTIKEISEHVTTIKTGVDEMIEARKVANNLADTEERAVAYSEKVKSYFETIRYHVDKLELIVDDEDWPLVKYRELLFLK
ncbi:MAG: glutamine synthetase type III, partial [Ferruginibacter sp.]|nr:glutamine synthetase type III [Cytophagales bacterium]